MKRLSLSCLLVILHFSVSAQWTSSGFNYTTDRLAIGTNAWSGKRLNVQGNDADHLALLENASSSGFGMYLRAANDPLRIVPFSGSGDHLFVVSGNGNVGIGTSSPSSRLHIVGTGSNINGGNSNVISGDLVVQSNTGGRSISSGAELEFVIPANSDGSNLWGQGRIITVAGNTNSGSASGKMILGTRRTFNKLGTGVEWYYGDDITIDQIGNVGVGTTTPSSKFHISGIGSNVNGGNNSIISGDLVIQSNTGGRSASSGAELEFVIPANSDGSNLWGQGRIITVAGNTSSGNASGKMILGTRRTFNKLGTGAEWYYGDDITIDAVGNVGIGTTVPDAMLAVKGDIHTKEVRVDVTGAMVGDYVFEGNYNLIALPELETYLKQNKHLPEVPSAKEFEAEGMKLKEMNLMLLKKVEELTLYMIELKKENESFKQTGEELMKQNAELSTRVLKLETK